MGKPTTKELIHFYPGDGMGVAGDLIDAVAEGWVDTPNELEALEEAKCEAYELTRQAPNIALNVHKTMASRAEIRAFATLGVILQLLAFVIPALSTYHWRWPKSGSQGITSYAYPFFLAGSFAITVGVALCSHVIDATTVERTYEGETPLKDQIFEVFRLQFPCTVGEQFFPGCIILDPPGNTCIRTSRLNSSTRSLRWVR